MSKPLGTSGFMYMFEVALPQHATLLIWRGAFCLGRASPPEMQIGASPEKERGPNSRFPGDANPSHGMQPHLGRLWPVESSKIVVCTHHTQSLQSLADKTGKPWAMCPAPTLTVQPMILQFGTAICCGASQK